MGAEVLDDVEAKIANEINSIKVDNTVEYQPEAWTREGATD
jgi:hypothetical protein